MNGTLEILNVGDGDTKLSFDKTKPAEVARAAKAVTEMLRRGYAILVEVGEKDGKPLYQRAEDFDPETCEYIIVGVPEDEEEAQEAPAPAPEAAPRRRGRPRKTETTRVPAASTRAVSVPRSAGG